MKIVLLLSFFCFLFSCNETVSTRTEQVEFSIDDSSFTVNNNFTFSVYFPDDTLRGLNNGDSVKFMVPNITARYANVEFRIGQYNLNVDSIPIGVLFPNQHVNYRFGISEKAQIKANQIKDSGIDNLKYQFLVVDPTESGMGRVFEKRYLP